MKKIFYFVIVILFCISLGFNYFLFNVKNNIIIQNKEKKYNIKINKDKDDFLENKYNLFSNSDIDLKIGKNDRKVLEKMCNDNIRSFEKLKSFKQKNESLFKKIFLGFNGEKYLSDKHIKGGLYFYDNCDFINKDKNKGFYGECIIRINENNIFLRNNNEIIDLQEFPFSMNKLKQNVESGNCKYLLNNKYFSDFYEYCKNKDKYIIFLDNITNKLITKVCEK